MSILTSQTQRACQLTWHTWSQGGETLSKIKNILITPPDMRSRGRGLLGVLDVFSGRQDVLGHVPLSLRGWW